MLNAAAMCSAGNVVTNVSAVKLTYSDIQRLSTASLNKHCRSFNIDTSLPKSAKINAVCHCCDATTAGESQTLSLTTLPRTAESLSKSQLLELQSLTPKVLYSLSNWSTDIATIPVVDEADVKRYLLQTDTLTPECERTYKLSRPYQMKQFVHSVQICNLSSFSVIRAQCLPSQSTNKDDVKLMHIVIDRVTGQPYGGYCTCTVGYVLLCNYTCFHNFGGFETTASNLIHSWNVHMLICLIYVSIVLLCCTLLLCNDQLVEYFFVC